MNWSVIIVIAILVIIGAVIFHFEYKKYKQFKKLEREAFANFDESAILRSLFDCIILWKVEHQYEDLSHPEAQEIIQQHIKEIRSLRDTYPEIDFETRIAKLSHLLDK